MATATKDLQIGGSGLPPVKGCSEAEALGVVMVALRFDAIELKVFSAAALVALATKCLPKPV